MKCVKKGVIMTRHLTCCCKACRTGVGNCNFSHVTGVWSSHTLRPPGERRKKQPKKPAQLHQRRTKRNETHLGSQTAAETVQTMANSQMSLPPTAAPGSVEINQSELSGESHPMAPCTGEVQHLPILAKSTETVAVLLDCQMSG